MANEKAGDLWTKEEDKELADRLARFFADSMFIHQRTYGGIRARVKMFLSQGHDSLTDRAVSELGEKIGNTGD